MRSKEWRDVPDYSRYHVSEDGDVQNKNTGRILKACDNNSGYKTVNLYNEEGRSTRLVHRLVAELYNDDFDPDLEVNHKDGDKHNNRYDNLESVTRGDNASHAYRTGLKQGPNSQPVRVVETDETFESIKACARAIQGDARHIKHCLDGEVYTHKGLSFEYGDCDDEMVRDIENCESRRVAVHKPYRRSVRVIETDEVYSSISECAEAIGANGPSITACLKGRHKTHKGYHYEYADDYENEEEDYYVD